MTTNLATSLLPRVPFSVQEIRKDFPILDTVTYFDSAASKHRPTQVLQAMQTFYETSYANVHRGIHSMGARATAQFERVRDQVKELINAPRREEIIFTKGATEAINLVAYSFGELLEPGDEILLTQMEHHANIVPWQMLAERRGVVIKVLPVQADGTLNIDELASMLSAKTKLVSIAHVSNALGVINDVFTIIQAARVVGAKVMLDGCQAPAHIAIDVQDLDVDFYTFSGHKMYGPNGIGVLYGRYDLLDAMPPYQGGGEMIDVVTFEETTYADLPYKFEAGTPAIGEVIGLGAAITYLQGLDIGGKNFHEQALLAQAVEIVKRFDGLKIWGGKQEKRVSVLSFSHDKIHANDIASLLDEQGICVRSGNHCAQPLMQALGVPGTVRISLAMYNTAEEVERLRPALAKAMKMLG